MKSSYDYTKDDRYKSYEKFVYDSLLKLGFRITNVGTMYLKDIILFAYFNKYYEICVTKLVKDFMKSRKIKHISHRTLINCIEYSINTTNHIELCTNFQKILKIKYNDYSCSVKNILIIFLNLLQ